MIFENSAFTTPTMVLSTLSSAKYLDITYLSPPPRGAIPSTPPYRTELVGLAMAPMLKEKTLHTFFCEVPRYHILITSSSRSNPVDSPLQNRTGGSSYGTHAKRENGPHFLLRSTSISHTYHLLLAEQSRRLPPKEFRKKEVILLCDFAILRA